MHGLRGPGHLNGDPKILDEHCHEIVGGFNPFFLVML
jgi:hypothetical protein